MAFEKMSSNFSSHHNFVMSIVSSTTPIAITASDMEAINHAAIIKNWTCGDR